MTGYIIGAALTVILGLFVYGIYKYQTSRDLPCDRFHDHHHGRNG